MVGMPSTAGVKCDVDACTSVLTASCLAMLQVVLDNCQQQLQIVDSQIWSGTVSIVQLFLTLLDHNNWMFAAVSAPWLCLRRSVPRNVSKKVSPASRLTCLVYWIGRPKSHSLLTGSGSWFFTFFRCFQCFQCMSCFLLKKSDDDLD